MEHQTNEQLGKKGRSRGRLLLGVSLVVNMVFVGFVAGAFLRHDGGRDSFERGPDAATFGAPYIRALPRETRQEVLQAARAATDQPMPDRTARRALFHEVLDSMRATPFDAERMQRLVEDQARVSVAVQQRVQTAWVAAVESMTDQQRAAYADAVEDIVRRGPKHR